MNSKALAWMVVAALAAAAPTLADEQPKAGSAGGVKADIRASFDEAADKLVQLALAIPQEKYGWAPASDVRTTAQVFLHVAGGNYFLGGIAGTPRPADVPKDIEKETDKAKVIATLTAAIDHAHRVIDSMPDSELDQTVDFFGHPASKRSILLRMAAHAHEHLGQAIAYARSVGVAPPWSKKAE